MVSCVYVCCMVVVCFFFFKQKTAYEMRISDWSSDVLFRSGGLGRPSAIACARAGATVVLLGRKVPKLNRVYDAIAKSDEGLPEPVNYPFDLEGASRDDHADLARRIEEGFGRLDGLLHCAADFHGLTSLERSDPGRFARRVHVHLKMGRANDWTPVPTRPP